MASHVAPGPTPFWHEGCFLIGPTHAIRQTARGASPLSQRVLDPLERMSEILFGIIMVLTFTGSIRVAEAGREDLRTVLAGALGCNLAWGVVDAAMYLMAAFMSRARLLVTLETIRRSP